MEIKSLIAEHYPQVAQIYEEGIATGKATFQTKAYSWEDWDKGHLNFCRFGAFQDDILMGWVALSPVSSRCVYAGVAELGIYVAEAHRGKGVGQKLLKTLVEESEKKGIWTLQAGIFAENTASIALHEKCGFRKVGFREKIGKLNNVWLDNVLMEKRSSFLG